MYRFLWGCAAFGVVLHLMGLAWDVYMHAKDRTLAAREGILTLENPSHALIIAGLGITTAALLGVAFVWAQERRLGGHGAVGTALRATALPCVALGAAGAVWLASLAEDNSSHGHEALAAHDHPEMVDLDPVFATFLAENHSHEGEPAVAAHDQSGMGEGSAHTHGTELAITPANLTEAAAFYDRVKVAAGRWEDVNQALKDGYVQITPDLPGIAAHFIHGGHNSDRELMNPEKPEILLYSKRMDGQWRLVGFMFSSEVATETPPSFFGPLDVWHRHENLCFTAGAQVSVKPSAADCAGGVFIKTTPWNLHVWTAPGGEGVFAHDFAPITPGAFPGASRPAAQDLVARP